MIWLPRFLRLSLVATSLVVLSGIIPISLSHFHTGDACPNLGPVPACYVVSVCYAAMGFAALLWEKPLGWLFYAGVIPVIILATTGTTLELVVGSTCPRSQSGWPLCYTSLIMGVTMALIFAFVRNFERKLNQTFT